MFFSDSQPAYIVRAFDRSPETGVKLHQEEFSLLESPDGDIALTPVYDQFSSIVHFSK